MYFRKAFQTSASSSGDAGSTRYPTALVQGGELIVSCLSAMQIEQMLHRNVDAMQVDAMKRGHKQQLEHNRLIAATWAHRCVRHRMPWADLITC